MCAWGFINGHAGLKLEVNREMVGIYVIIVKINVIYLYIQTRSEAKTAGGGGGASKLTK